MNSKIIIFYLCIAGVIGAAAIWKYTSHDDVEVGKTTVETVKETPKPKPKPKPKVEEPSMEPTGPHFATPEERAAAKKRAGKMMNLSMRYAGKPENVLRDIVYFQETGNEEEVDLLIDFLVETFPDFEIPENLIKE